MIKILQHIWRDIGRGENLDAYATIAVALTLSILNVTGLAPTSGIPAITLAVLALLAIGSLVNRHRIDDLAARMRPPMGTTFVDDFEAQFKEDLTAAHKIVLYGASLDGVANDYYSLFEGKLKQGYPMQVLVIDPGDTRVLELSEMRAYGNPSVQRARAKALATLADFCELRKTPGVKLEIRTLKFPITHRLVAVNPDDPNGRLYISNYAFKTASGSLPKFVLSAADGRWYELYNQEAKNLWDAATDWPCSEAVAIDRTAADASRELPANGIDD